MFDKLIESEPVGAEFKSRRSYFVTSTAVVGLLFISAVVISIYASDYGIGNAHLDLSELLAPVEMAATAPEPPKPRAPSAQTQEKTTLPSRTVNMARTDESTIVPTTTSSSRNTDVSRPDGRFNISTVNVDPVGPPAGEMGTTRSSGGPGGPELGGGEPAEKVEEVKITPPLVVAEKPKVSKAPVSGGVLNGSATRLPKPNYSPAAKAVGAQGQVKVQVLIDESGSVVSANAVSGHPLLQPDAERAARSARFTPTRLSNVPVKVTGVIVYNFLR